MPKTKAIFIPDWIKAAKKEQISPVSVFNFIPGLMHWRSAEFMAKALRAFTPNPQAHAQIDEVWQHLVALVQQINKDYSLVARVSASTHIPNQLMISLTHDVTRPEVVGVMVVRISDNGDITGVEREYSTKYNPEQ